MKTWRPDRAAGLERLAGFTPLMGEAYAVNRNTDFGPGRNHQVSGLSPWLRRRLVSEETVVRAALEAHGPRGADKFVQEVIWRTYWKGWLEMRPEIWTRFESELARLLAAGEAHTEAVQVAERGGTGIEGFDDWAWELVETGWLHNHARMWFASIWIFTLGLPWVLGADFFLRHLLDGDPASNTLSWRWVAGLQTPGKTYLATSDNIARFTEGRYRPRGLATVATPVTDASPPALQPLPSAVRVPPDGSHLLLVTAEDMSPEEVIAAAGVGGVALMSEPWFDGHGAPTRRFLEGAMGDTEQRLERRYGLGVRRLGPGSASGVGAEALIELAHAIGARAIVTPYAPVGPTALALAVMRPAIEGAGLDLVMVRRPWDSALWPLADRGFFKFRERAGPTLGSLGLPA